ncbi:MAG: four helix bundle protein [Bacteroidia bacterium]|nr:four helix bundle protein [Bacteroidia bacterium]
MTPRRVDQYPVFGQWYRTLNAIMDLCDKLPRSVRPTLTQQILQHSLEIIDLLTESIYQKERRPLLLRVNLRLEQLRILFRICFDRKYISGKQFEHLTSETDATGRMIGGWLKSPVAPHP